MEVVPADVVPSEPAGGGAASIGAHGLGVHNVVLQFADRTVIFHVTLLEGSVFLWVGGAELGIGDLKVATPTKYDTLPSVATVRGEGDGPGSAIAQRLSRRFGCLVFASFNLSNPEPDLMLFVQKEAARILGELLGAEPSPALAGPSAG
ncbi:unnamed protein product [Prorocentrum cordatum]|uniref:Proteasome assembly chaperone 3 n=1 Tax=Prorocentrum cordatum TaxID=2364126 RepID=A0ABN9R2J2_9DINO|nr:unnamed protein product [Polarella glacialis]